ncbi:MAG: prolyl oligopeptidase family serine peptidase [Deltaproteobacteria bacterium]|nr:prolyl oligopeptidase family serine peptidase [Deltaproteobacteria bacterium]
MILHEDLNLLVPVHQSRLLYEALQKLGTDATFHIVEGEGHGWNELTEVDNIVLQFFDKHLKTKDLIMR